MSRIRLLCLPVAATSARTSDSILWSRSQVSRSTFLHLRPPHSATVTRTRKLSAQRLTHVEHRARIRKSIT